MEAQNKSNKFVILNKIKNAGEDDLRSFHLGYLDEENNRVIMFGYENEKAETQHNTVVSGEMRASKSEPGEGFVYQEKENRPISYYRPIKPSDLFKGENEAGVPDDMKKGNAKGVSFFACMKALGGKDGKEISTLTPEEIDALEVRINTLYNDRANAAENQKARKTTAVQSITHDCEYGNHR